MMRDTADNDATTDPPGGLEPQEDPPPAGRSGRRGAAAAVVVMLLFGLAGWALVAAFVGDEVDGPEAGITLTGLAADPEELYGSTVVVSGEISEVLGAGEATGAQTASATGFVLGEDEQQVLVVGAEIPQMVALRGDGDVAEGDVVQVTGKVRKFDLAALEEELGSDLVEDDFTPYSDRPVLVASAVNLVPTTARQQGEQVALSADELADSPGEYLGMRLTVRDVSVDDGEQVLSPRAVALDNDVLIVGASGRTNVRPGFRGTVLGTLIEASTARLLNTIKLPQGAEDIALFDELGVDEQQLDSYDYVLVASRISRAG